MHALATYCPALQYDVTLYSFNAMLLDVQWNDMSDEQKLERVRAVCHSRFVASLGKAKTQHYIDDYCAFIEAGGKLKVFPTPKNR